MKTNKSYFLHQLKANSRPLIVVAICVLILGFYICIDNMDRVYTHYYNDDTQQYVHIIDKEHPNGQYYDEVLDKMVDYKTPPREIKTRELALYYPVVLLVIMCYVVPVWMFAFTKKRRNLDCCYSLPISKRGFGMTNYLVGLVLVFIPFLLSYIQNLIIYASISFEMFKNLDFSVLTTHFLICILMGLILYTLFVFVFNEANTVLDGCIFIIAYSVIGFFILLSVSNVFNFNLYDYYVLKLDGECAIPFAYFGELLSNYETTVERGVMSHITNAWADKGAKFWFIFWTIVGILSFVGFVLGLNNKKAEQTEDISTSVFGYKTLIPLAAIPGVISTLDFNPPYSYGDAISAMFITLAAVVGYTVYRRGVKYKISDYVVMGILLLFTVISASI
ncbi:MAG: hypothetical protein J6Q89_05845 [Clostridia bacterium]|nr:hypothetical protein [Clostridia bacterium]